MLNSAAEWRTDLYRPVVCTAVDDHSVGEQIGSGTLSGRYGGSYLDFHSVSIPAQLRISHARTGIRSSVSLKVRHAQFVHCDFAVDVP